jgi:ATP adenylyltransferase
LNREYFFSFGKLSYLKGKKPEGCILCLIRDGSPEVVDLSVYRDELFIVSINLYPYNPGHLLVWPLRHIEDIRQLSAKEEDRLRRLQRYLLDISDRILQPSGYNIGYNMGRTAGASIAHLHLHIIPRYPRELGIADLIAGKRVLVESPEETAERFRGGIAQSPFSRTSS